MADYKRTAARAAAQQRYALKHRLERNYKAMLTGRIKRAATKKFMVELKTGKLCQDCAKVFPWYVLQFDHRDATKKIAAVSQLARTAVTRECLLAEIAKCDLVCANCHAIRTYERKQQLRKMKIAQEVSL